MLPAPVRHSGDTLAGRYRLEECITQAGVFSSWRAVDEKLRRAVGVHLLAAGHDRSRTVLSAARSAALLGDPRFVQVLDAVESEGLVYVVREWLPDAVDLGSLLTAGPLEAHEAYRMVLQVTDGVVAAHRRGQPHLRLTPACVLRTDAGQYRINGIAVDAALHGLSSEDPGRQDTRAIGALLYAALAHRWPFPQGGYGLQGLPRDLGCVPPDQVRAGVHRGLSELAVRALCDRPPRGLAPITTPGDLLRAVSAMPKVRPPEPDPVTRIAPSGAPATGRRPGATGGAAPSFASAAVVPAAAGSAPVLPPTLPGRTGRLLKAGVSALVLTALALGSWGIADQFLQRGTAGRRTPVQADVDPAGPQTTGRPLPVARTVEFSPLAQPIAGDEAGRAHDGNTATAWRTALFYGNPAFGNLPARRDGSGIVVDLGRVRTVSGVKAVMYAPGQTVDVRAAGPSTTVLPQALSGFPTLVHRSEQAGAALDVKPSAPVRTRYLLIHVTALPPNPSGGFRGGISEITVLG